jgi:hypothetical protein
MPGIIAPNPPAVIQTTAPSPGNIKLLAQQIQAQSVRVVDSNSQQLFSLTSQAFINVQDQIDQVISYLRQPSPHEEVLQIIDQKGNLIGWIGYQVQNNVSYEGAWFSNLWLGGTSPTDALISFTYDSDIVTFNNVALTVNNSNVIFAYTGSGSSVFEIGGPAGVLTFHPYATGTLPFATLLLNVINGLSITYGGFTSTISAPISSGSNGLGYNVSSTGGVASLFSDVVDDQAGVLFTQGSNATVTLNVISGNAQLEMLSSGGGGSLIFLTLTSGSPELQMVGVGGEVVLTPAQLSISNLPNGNPGAGSKQLYYESADSNRVYYAA